MINWYVILEETAFIPDSTCITARVTPAITSPAKFPLQSYGTAHPRIGSAFFIFFNTNFRVGFLISPCLSIRFRRFRNLFENSDLAFSVLLGFWDPSIKGLRRNHLIITSREVIRLWTISRFFYKMIIGWSIYEIYF